MSARAAFLLAALLLAALGARAEEAPAAGRQEEAVEVQRGLASWYGARFHGRRTASGERFDMHALTAAHRSLPFGSVVRVTSLVNGRTVDVRINDRGPHIKRRVLDLSRAAAEKLGLLAAGTGTKQVAISVVSVRRSSPPPGPSEAGPGR